MSIPMQRARFSKLVMACMSLCLISCYPTPRPDKSFTGAVLGTGWGMGAGAIIGNQVGEVGAGLGYGALYGGTAGFITGVGLDIAEGTELEQQRKLDALYVQVASNSRRLSAMQDALDDRDQQLNRANTGDTVYFDPGRASLRAGSAAQLQRLADSIKFNPYVRSVIVHGHTDDMGNTERNERLAEARARSVATFLATQGISIDQIRIEVHGARRPIASNESESGRQLNRRVEVTLKK